MVTESVNTKYDKAWFISILDALDDLILIKGEKSKLLWANQAFQEYYGLTNDDLLNIVDSPHSDPDDTVQYVRDDHYVYTTGNRLDILAEPVTDKNGEIGYFHTIKTAVLNKDGDVTHTVGISRPQLDADVIDYFKQVRGTRKLDLGEFRAFITNIPLAVAMFDAKNRYLSHSVEWTKLFDYDDEVPLVKQFYDTTFEAILPLADELTSVLNQGIEITKESVTIQRVGQDDLVVEARIRPWKLPTDQIGGTIVIVHDITHLKQVQTSLLHANEELLQFNYRVSHDLVAPLRTTRGFLDINRRFIAEGKIAEALELNQKIAERIEHLSGLIEGVLNLTRSEMTHIVNEPIDLQELIKNIIKFHETELSDASIIVSTSLNCPPFFSQKVRVRQILENLISNAIKYYDKEKNNHNRTVKISAELVAGQVTITIADNGIGFDKSQAELIFDIFTRGTTKRGGHGLGLYLVYKHVQKLGGKITVLSNRDDTVFQVSFPYNSKESF